MLCGVSAQNAELNTGEDSIAVVEMCRDLADVHRKEFENDKAIALYLRAHSIITQVRGEVRFF